MINNIKERLIEGLVILKDLILFNLKLFYLEIYCVLFDLKLFMFVVCFVVFIGIIEGFEFIKFRLVIFKV